MMILQERCFSEGVLEIQLGSDLRYLLRYGDLVRYENHEKTIRGKPQSYQFKSVEQLRYDFERDVRAAGEAAWRKSLSCGSGRRPTR